MHTFAYDALGRLTRTVYPSGQQHWLFYDKGGRVAEGRSYRRLRRRCTMHGDGGGMMRPGRLDTLLVLSQGGRWTTPGDFTPFSSQRELRQALSRLLHVVETLGMRWFRRKIEFYTWLDQQAEKYEKLQRPFGG